MNKSIPMHQSNILSSLLLSIALIIAGTTLGIALYKSRQTPRYVSVRGLAEREVTADVAIWPIKFNLIDDDLGTLHKKLEKQGVIITEFLTRQGLNQEELTHGVTSITDKKSYYRETETKQPRYAAEATITVCSNNVLAVGNALQQTNELVAKGIVIGDTYGWRGYLQFHFTKLNEIKPAMIQEATINARKAAEQFAQDSGCKVGSIRHAVQGLFSIEDTHTPTKKKVRVVTTVEYFLVGN